MKITIIDLLNKIANGEEVPKKIKYKGYVYKWDNDAPDYIYENERERLYLFDEFVCDLCNILNDEVKIIEEDKKIEKIDLFTLYKEDMERTEILQNNFIEIKDKINEIIDVINEDKNE